MKILIWFFLLNNIQKINLLGISTRTQMKWNAKQSHQVYHKGTNYMYVIAEGSNAFKYSVTKSSFSLTWSNKTYLNDYQSTVIDSIQNNRFAFACGTTHLTLSSDTGVWKSEYINPNKPINHANKGAFIELEEELYFIAYSTQDEVASTWSYYFEVLETFYDDTNAEYLQQLYSYETTGAQGDISCTLNENIHCIFKRDTALMGIALTDRLRKKGSEVTIDSVFPLQIKIVNLNNTSTVFALSESLLKAMKLIINSSTKGLVSSTWSIIFTLSGFTSFDVIAISTMEFIYAITATENIYVQKGFISNETGLSSDFAPLTIVGGSLTKISFGLFNQLNVGLLVHDEGKSNYLYMIDFFQCSNFTSPAKTNSVNYLRSQISNSNSGYSLKFSQIDSNILSYNGDFTSIDTYSLKFQASKGGKYYYEYVIQRVLSSYNGYSIACYITYDVCNEKCETCDSNYNYCTKCRSSYYFMEGYPNQCFKSSEILTGYYLPSGGDTYFKCSQSCYSCSSTETSCISCASGYVYQIKGGKICVPQCDSNQYLYYDSQNNYQCTSDLNCPVSHPYLYQYDRQCFVNCKLEGYWKYSSNTCTSSCYSPYPLYVSSTMECTDSCPLSLFKNGNNCIASCPSAYYQLENQRECSLTCPDYRIPSTKQCVSSCTSPLKSNIQTKECVNSCSISPQCEEDANEKFTIDIKSQCAMLNIGDCNTYQANSENQAILLNLKKECKVKFFENGNECVLDCPVYKNKITLQCVTTCDNSYEDTINKICDSSCERGFKIDTPKKQCVDDCLNGQFSDSKSNQCVNVCTLSQLHNTINNKCVDKCPEELKFVNPNNLYCIQSCISNGLFLNTDQKTCSTNCLASDFYDPVNKICYIACPLDYYIDTINRKCYQESDCKTANKFVNKETKTCVDTCLLDTLYDDSKCHECVSTCTDNQYKYKDDTAMICAASCAGYPNRYQDSLAMACVETCSDSQYKYNTDKTCVADCEVHSLYSDDNARLCINACGLGQFTYESKKVCTSTCKTYNLFADSLTKQCSENCSGSQFKDKVDYLCVDTCKNSLYFDKEKDECVEFCRTGYYRDPSTMRCVQTCPNANQFYNVDICTNECLPKRLNPSNNACLIQCESTKYFKKDENQCVDACPNEMFYEIQPTLEKKCVDTCSTPYYIDTTKECVGFCPSPLYRYGQKCIASCPTGVYRYEINKECLDNCLASTFVNGMDCVNACPLNMVIHLKICKDVCPDDTFKDIATKECVTTCGAKYTDITAKTCVASCKSTQFIYNFGCYEGKCPSLTYREETSNKCMDNCGVLLFNQRDQTCVASCEPTLFLDNSKRSCFEVCPEGMFIDRNQMECIFSCGLRKADKITRECVDNCEAPRYVDKINNLCMNDCDTKFYRAKNSILECIDSCETMYLLPDDKECVVSCTKPLFTDKVNMKCVVDCPSYAYLLLVSDKKDCVEDCHYYGQIPDKENMKCHLECPSDMYYDKNLKECIRDCQKFIQEKERICLDVCEPTHYLVSDKQRCVESCSEVQLYPNYLSKTCNSECLKGKIKDNLTYECLELKEAIGENNDAIENNIQDIYKDTPVIVNGNTTLEIIDSSSSGGKINSDSSSIDLGDCEKKLKEHYQIPEEESLLIMKIDKKPEDNHLSNTVEFTIFSKDGKKLDKEICKDIPINIQIPIKDTYAETLEEAKKYSSLGIDVNNKSDPFFNDVCYPFTSENNTDVPLNDRLNSVFNSQSENLCQKGCTYQGMDYQYNTVKCQCSTDNITEGNNETQTKSALEETAALILQELLGVILNSNVGVLFCYKNVFSKNIVSNLGFYLSTMLTIGIGIFSVFFFIHWIQPIQLYISQEFKHILEKSIPEEFENECKGNPPNRRSHHSIAQEESTSPYNLSYLAHRAENNKSINFKYDEKKNAYLRKNSNIRIKTMPLPIHHYSDEELEEMSFKDSIKYDKRSIFVLYWNYFKQIHPILQTFIVKNRKKLQYQLYSKFLFGILINFGLSALFYSTDFISHNNQNGSTDFWYNLPISIYTYIFGSLINFLLNFLASTEQGIDDIKECQDKNKASIRMVRYTKCLTIRLIIYSLIIIILTGLFSYFIVAFCGVYSNSQDEWIESGLISFGLEMALPFIFAYVFCVIRYVSIWKKSELLFKIAQIITHLLG